MSPRIIECASCSGDGYADVIGSRRCQRCEEIEVEDEPMEFEDFDECFGTDMQAALEADAVKLTQLTDEEHAVIFLDDTELQP